MNDVESDLVDADEVRHDEVLRLMRSVRALSVALVCLFLVLGLGGVALFHYLDGTRNVTTDVRDVTTEVRDATKKLARQQNLVVCDGYRRNKIEPPDDLECP